MTGRELLKDKEKIVIKIGTSTITHEKTGALNLRKLEKLSQVLTDLTNQGKSVVLVSSGAISVGRKALGMKQKPTEKSLKQACAAVGQAKLMMVYQKLFSEYNQMLAQVLMTKYTMLDDISRENAQNTFKELLDLHIIPVVNENDTVSTDEIEFGDNDTLSALVAALIQADLLILMSDIDGLYTDDPSKNPEASFISIVGKIDETICNMGKDTATGYGTGGMATKIAAARIATDSGADMVIVNGADMGVLEDVLEGKNVGTLFKAHKNENFDMMDYIRNGQKATI